MKDPLKYFLQEGFGHIFAAPIPDGGYHIDARWAMAYKDFIPKLVVTTNGNKAFLLQNILYPLDEQFIEKYAVVLSSPEEVQKSIDKKNIEWAEISKENIYLIKALNSTCDRN